MPRAREAIMERVVVAIYLSLPPAWQSTDLPAGSKPGPAQQQATRRFLAQNETGPRCCDQGAI